MEKGGVGSHVDTLPASGLRGSFARRRGGENKRSSQNLPSSPTSPLTTMSRLPRRPTRTRARNVASTLSIVFFALLAVLCLCPVANADDKSEYGTVIGIGEFTQHFLRVE